MPLHFPYKTKCRVYSDSDELIDCRWVVCEDQRAILNYPSAFVSKYWQPREPNYTGIGEYPPAKKKVIWHQKPQWQNGINCITDPDVLINGITQQQKLSPIGLQPCCVPDLNCDCGIQLEQSTTVIVQEDLNCIFLELCPGICSILTEQDAQPILTEWDAFIEPEDCD